MIKFVLWLITPEREIMDKWYRLFSRERLDVKPLPCLSAVGGIPQDTWGLAFIEICAEGLASPEDLKNFLSGRKNVSVIVFSRPGKISNSEISGFLENGADDFITIDIDDGVLFSKTKAHIRRLLPSLNAARTIIISRNGNVEIDRVKRTVKTGFKSRKEKIIENLTPKEFDIFSLLLCKEGEIVGRSFLMEELWKEKSGGVNCETIDKHVETLRRKLGVYGKNIRTVYGAGYRYERRDALG
ncbi:MAG: winged helix-turn-helix domain-containing protein [Elusimicrobia bacterium]|nr:winged helix-turn-helix domain-containing protein [Elusimicrobiota bacterium]